MPCIKCASIRIFHVSAKCRDLCYVESNIGTSHDGYVPFNIGIGGGDYVDFHYCIDCGQIQGTFPTKFKKKFQV